MYRGLYTEGPSSCKVWIRRYAEGALIGRQDEVTTPLPSGCQLDLVGDPCVVVLRREDGTVVARFNHNVDPEEIRQTAVEDHQGPPH